MGFDIFGSLNQAITAPIAAQYEQDALKNARSTQQQQYGVDKGYYQPYYDTGTAAMRSLYGNVQNGAYNVNVTPQNLGQDPGYQFQLQQGQQALQRSAAAQGGLNSGGFAKALDNYSQGLASTQYQNAWNRQFQQNQFNYNSLASMAGMGERSAGNLAGLGQNYGNTMAGYDIAKGNIQAAGITGMAQGAGGFADGSMGMGLSMASGGMGGMGGGGGAGLSAGNPYSMAPLGNGGYPSGMGGGASLGSIGYAQGIPAQGYGGDALNGWGNGGPYSLIPQQGGGY